MKTLNEIPNLQNKKVLVRADIDVVLDGKIDPFRLNAGLPTLKYIIEGRGKPIICGHIGKPKGFDESLSTKQLIPFFDENLGGGNYELLENTKFNQGEIEGSVEFAKELAYKADIYVNDSFATCHRNYASITEIPKLLEAYAGRRLEEEITTLQKAITDPERPLVAIIGGAKLESKLPTVEKFLEIANKVMIGGKLGLQWDKEVPDNLVIPSDYATDNLDIGPQTIQEFLSNLETAKTVIWAGPMGYYEEDAYLQGTKELAQKISTTDIYSIVGGGDTISAIRKAGYLDNISFVSTGGGAMLNFITEGTLPGIEALN